MISAETLRRISTHEDPALVVPLAEAMSDLLPRYGIDTPLRVAHFLAQAAQETDGFHTLHEYASGRAYEQRTDLGNTAAIDGDGPRYKGRGIFMFTGQDNYRRFGARIGRDLIAHPDLAADPATSVLLACEYWTAHGCNAAADRDDIVAVTEAINGGRNGLKDRQLYLARIKPLLI